MPTDSALPENIQSLLDRADMSLLRGKHGEASTLLWKATEAAIRKAAQSRGHRLASSDYDEVEPFIDRLDEQAGTGAGLMSGYLITLEFQANGDGGLMDLDDVVFYEPLVRTFINDLLAVAA